MVLPMTGAETFYTQGEVAIDNGKILSVGPQGSAPEGWTPDIVYANPDFLAMPGLVNGHTHAAMTLLRSYADDLPLMEWLETKIWPFEAKLTHEDIYWGTKLCIVEMLLSGTTTMVDMYDGMDRVAEAVEEIGSRAVLSRGLIGSAPNGATALAENEALLKMWHGKANGRIQVRLGPHAPYTCPPEYLRKVMDIAAKYNAGINIHLAETKGEVDDIR
ncbi:MAG TPA: amidohydrolase family protein, partial [Desulfobacteria bacterium]|nr:amidohydrolase family protein [Desulfobacteria bacterium]